MRLDDPTRPRVEGTDRPRLLLPDGSPGPACPLPEIIPPSKWRVRVLLAIGPTLGRWFEKEFDEEWQIAHFFDRWNENPEEVARKELGWEWNPRDAERVGRELDKVGVRLSAPTKTAEELGL